MKVGSLTARGAAREEDALWRRRKAREPLLDGGNEIVGAAEPNGLAMPSSSPMDRRAASCWRANRRQISMADRAYPRVKWIVRLRRRGCRRRGRLPRIAPADNPQSRAQRPRADGSRHASRTLRRLPNKSPSQRRQVARRVINVGGAVESECAMAVRVVDRSLCERDGVAAGRERDQEEAARAQRRRALHQISPRKTRAKCSRRRRCAVPERKKKADGVDESVARKARARPSLCRTRGGVAPQQLRSPWPTPRLTDAWIQRLLDSGSSLRGSLSTQAATSTKWDHVALRGSRPRRHGSRLDVSARADVNLYSLAEDTRLPKTALYWRALPQQPCVNATRCLARGGPV